MSSFGHVGFQPIIRRKTAAKASSEPTTTISRSNQDDPLNHDNRPGKERIPTQAQVQISNLSQRDNNLMISQRTLSSGLGGVGGSIDPSKLYRVQKTPAKQAKQPVREETQEEVDEFFGDSVPVQKAIPPKPDPSRSLTRTKVKAKVRSVPVPEPEPEEEDFEGLRKQVVLLKSLVSKLLANQQVLEDKVQQVVDVSAQIEISTKKKLSEVNDVKDEMLASSHALTNHMAEIKGMIGDKDILETLDTFGYQLQDALDRTNWFWGTIQVDNLPLFLDIPESTVDAKNLSNRVQSDSLELGAPVLCFPPVERHQGVGTFVRCRTVDKHTAENVDFWIPISLHYKFFLNNLEAAKELAHPKTLEVTGLANFSIDLVPEEDYESEEEEREPEVPKKGVKPGLTSDQIMNKVFAKASKTDPEEEQGEELLEEDDPEDKYE